MAKDVIVVVQRNALPTKKDSLDILLVSTAGACPVAVYRDIESVKAVYGPSGTTPNAKIVRKATTLLNQGKTTLADTLVTKFKIVGFDRPKSTPGTVASIAITFPAILPEKIEEGSNVTLKVGGAEIENITPNEITTGKDLAELFTSTSFTASGKIFNSAVSNTTLTYTATTIGVVSGVSDSIQIDTEINDTDNLDIYTNASVVFTNGTDATSGEDTPEALVATIKKFQSDIDNDWYLFMTDRDEPAFVKALAKFAEASEPSEAELGAGIEDHRKFYMGQTTDKNFAQETARAAVIYTDPAYIDEEPDASYTGNVAPFYPNNVTWKFKRPQNGNAASTALISLPQLKDSERDALLENHVNFLTEEYKRQYVKEGTCLDGEFIDVVLGGDWIAQRMRDLLYDILLTNANIEYTDAGFGLISTAVLQALAEAVDYNIIARDPESLAGIFTVIIPKYSESTDEQRRNRIMPDIIWEALLAGAVHQVKVKGVLRASL